MVLPLGTTSVNSVIVTPSGTPTVTEPPGVSSGTEYCTRAV